MAEIFLVRLKARLSAAVMGLVWGGLQGGTSSLCSVMVASSTVWEREKKDTIVGSDPGVVGRADVPALIQGVRKLKFREKAIMSSRLHRAWQNRDLNLAVGALILLIASPLHQHLPLQQF